MCALFAELLRSLESDENSRMSLIYSVPVVVTPNPFQVAFKALLKKVKTRTLTIAQPGIEFPPHINGHWSPKQDK